MKEWLAIVFESIRFIKRYRERKQAERDSQSRERAAEREHLRLLIQGALGQLVELAKANQEGLTAQAQASAAQAEVLATWLKSFQPSSPDPEPSRTLRDEDEWAMEQERLEKEDPETYLHQLPPEWRVAYALDKLDKSKDPNPNFDREGRDFV